MKIACIQLNAGDDWKKNLLAIKKQITYAAGKKARLIALPESFYWRGSSNELKTIAKDVTPFVLNELKKIAHEKKVAILAGSVIEMPNKKKCIKNNRFFNTSILISEKGKILSSYKKMHLFNISLKGVKQKEAKFILSGKKIVSTKVLGKHVGFSICYDLRFPEQYRVLSRRGISIFFIPSNFTYVTGAAHWEVLLRARAIENQAFVIAPAQVGYHPSTGILSYGHSMIIGPWGDVLREGGSKWPEILIADLDFSKQDKLRRSFPVLNDCKIKIKSS